METDSSDQYHRLYELCLTLCHISATRLRLGFRTPSGYYLLVLWSRRLPKQPNQGLDYQLTHDGKAPDAKPQLRGNCPLNVLEKKAMAAHGVLHPSGSHPGPVETLHVFGSRVPPTLRIVDVIMAVHGRIFFAASGIPLRARKLVRWKISRPEAMRSARRRRGTLLREQSD